MNIHNPQTIYLVEILNGGHREAFMQLFAKCLLESGHRVVCIMPDTRIVEQWLMQHGAEFTGRYQLRQVPYPVAHSDKHGVISSFLGNLNTWRYYAQHIRQIEKETGQQADLVFINCLDGFIGNYLPYPAVDLVFRYPWAGLYFMPAHLRNTRGPERFRIGLSSLDHVFQSKNCIALALHDEGIISDYNKRLKSDKVLLLPETADLTPPDPENALARKIRQQANGRIIVGIIGMEPYKGSYEFMRLAKNADAGKYFFAFCGKFEEGYYTKFHTPERAEAFRNFIEALPENCLWAPGILAEGAEYNAVFNALDVMFLFYHNFTGSSNRLTKAAHFQKPVIAAEKNCVGEDVIHYQLGETVPDDSDASFLSALERVRRKIEKQELPLDLWKAYSEKNSESALKIKWEEIISRLHHR